MVVSLLAAAALLGLVVHLALAVAQRRLLTAPPAPPPAELPLVSVLKPLKGLDPDLAANLESCFRLDYPHFEVVLGVDDPGDPALAVARNVAARHPQVPAVLTVAGRRRVPNPKVDNLAAMLPAAGGEVLLISDSNVAAPPELLRRMVAALARPGVGLVTSPIRAVRGRGVWSTVEALQLNGFVMGGVAAAARAGAVCAVGKSMLLRRTELEQVGGLQFLGEHLAEDQLCGVRVARLGLATVVVGPPVDNVLGRLGLRQVVGRHLRWARIRRRMAPAAYAAELLANPAPWALGALLLAPGPWTLALALAATLGCGALAVSSARRLGAGGPPAALLLLEAVRQLLVTALWPVPWLSRTVTWRGQRYRIGALTRLELVSGDPPPPEGSLWNGEELEPQEATG